MISEVALKTFFVPIDVALFCFEGVVRQYTPESHEYKQPDMQSTIPGFSSLPEFHYNGSRFRLGKPFECDFQSCQLGHLAPFLRSPFPSTIQ